LYFVLGISHNAINSHRDLDEAHHKRKPRFENKAPLKPIEAEEVMERQQIDLVNFTSLEKEECRYVLNVIDICSKYMWLRPLPNKRCATVAKEMAKIWREFGTPRICQSDNGSGVILIQLFQSQT